MCSGRIVLPPTSLWHLEVQEDTQHKGLGHSIFIDANSESSIYYCVLREGTHLDRTGWKSLPHLWTQYRLLCPQTQTCDCPDSSQPLLATRNCNLNLTLCWSWILPAGLRQENAACILVPHFCCCCTPSHAFLLTSCVVLHSSFLQGKALALLNACTTTHGHYDLHIWEQMFCLYLCNNRGINQIIAVESLQAQEVLLKCLHWEEM